MDNFEIDFDHLRQHIRWTGERLRAALEQEDWAEAERLLDDLEAMHERVSWIAQDFRDKNA